MNPFTHHYPVAFDPKTPMSAQSTRHEQLVGHLHRTMPTTIARLEKAYPGATYAGLGRDVVVMSDGTAAAADAFLASHLASERLQMGPGALGPVHALQISGIGYGLEWHGSFGPMTRTGSGVTTQPGAVANLETRESILWEAHEMLRVTESPEFRASVEREAQLLGMKAPHHNAGN